MSCVNDILSAIDGLAPWRLAQEWDNSGLLLGDGTRPVRRALVCLDVTERVCDEADLAGADLVVAHHPLFYKPQKALTTATRSGRLALRLAAAGRAVIACHTNLDAAEGGIGDILARSLGLADCEPLRPSPPPPRFKVVVFVPASDLDGVRDAAFAAGAGRIGRYSECGFSAEGLGTFLPGQGTEPAVGLQGVRNSVREHRLELLCDGQSLAAVLAAVGRAHSYEEPAIDVYPLWSGAEGAGVGRVGRLSPPRRLADVADLVGKVLDLDHVHYAGDAGLMVERVAVVAGGGSGLGGAVVAAACQAYVTGELKYHEVQDLAASGVGVILGGHHQTERVPLLAWLPRLAAAVPDVEFLASQTEEDPVQLR